MNTEPEPELTMTATTAPMTLDEAYQYLVERFTLFLWTGSVEPEAVQQAVQQGTGGGLVTMEHAREEDGKKLLPLGYTIGTGLYHVVMEELPHACLGSGEGGQQPGKLMGLESGFNEVCQDGQISGGHTVAMEEGAHALERSHADGKRA